MAGVNDLEGEMARSLPAVAVVTQMLASHATTVTRGQAH